MNTNHEKVDVLIVGAGPTGLTLATALRRLGVCPMVIDRQVEGANTSRAAVVHARTLEVLEDLNVTASLIERGLKVPKFTVRERDKQLLQVDFSTLDTLYPFTLMIPQNETEQLILQQLEAWGGRVDRPVELMQIRVTSERVEAILTSGSGERIVSARWIVGCDGAHSFVRKASGIPFEGADYEEAFVLADVTMDWSLSGNEASLFLSERGLLLIAPLPDDRFRVVATVEHAPTKIDQELIQQIVDERGPTARSKVTNVVWTSNFHIEHRVSRSPLLGRVLLCGDAAHVHSPAGGQGMNTAIQDAASLAEPLSQALLTRSTEGLEQWAARRHEIAKKVVSMTDKMTKVGTLRSRVLRDIRNVALSLAGGFSFVTEQIAKSLAELDNR